MLLIQSFISVALSALRCQVAAIVAVAVAGAALLGAQGAAQAQAPASAPPAEAKNNFNAPMLAIPSNAAPLTIAMDDAALWNGRRVMPTMQCSRNGGDKQASPKLSVSAVPEGAQSLVVFVRNEPPSFDSHGLFRVLRNPNGSAVWAVPSLRSGHALDKLPKGVNLFAGGDTWGRVYSAPCPSAGSWRYTVAVYALDAADAVLGYGKIEMGYAP